jgi:hypothetical protein
MLFPSRTELKFSSVTNKSGESLLVALALQQICSVRIFNCVCNGRRLARSFTLDLGPQVRPLFGYHQEHFRGSLPSRKPKLLQLHSKASTLQLVTTISGIS